MMSSEIIKNEAVKKFVVFSFVFIFLVLICFVPQVSIAEETQSEQSENIQIENIPTEAPHKISLSLKSADLLDVLSMLTLKTEWNLVIGPEVSGEISLNLHEVTVEDALAAVVRVSGFAIERKDDILYVTTHEKIVGLPFPEETEHKTYRLSYADVNEAAKVIQSYLSPYGKLTIHKSGNTLFIDDIPETFHIIEPILSELDQQQTLTETENRSYPLSYVNIDEAAEVVQDYLSPHGKLTIHKSSNTLFIDDISESLDKIGPILLELDARHTPLATDKKTYRLSFIKLEAAAEIIKKYLSPHGKITLHQTIGTLFIEDIPETFLKIDPILEEIDLPPTPEQFEHKTYKLSYADLEEAAVVMKSYLSPNGKLSINAANDQIFIDDIPEVLKKLEPVVHFLDQAPIPETMPTRTYRLAYVKGADAEEVIKEYLSPYGKLTLHKSGDMLFIEDTAEAFEKIEMIIGEMNRPPKQVMIEARIFEIQLNDDLSYGIDWNAVFNPSNATETIQTSGFSKTAASASEGFFFSMATPEITMLLSALEKKGTLNTLATPKLLALNHKPAKIVIGGRLGFKVTTTTNLVTQESVEFLDTGTQLRITPHIDDSGNILMDIHPEISDGVISEGLPQKTTTEVTTSLMAKDGESIFIGGLIRERQEEIKRKVPILGSIPLLGFFFSRTEIKKLKSEIIVVITPHLTQQQVQVPFTLEQNKPLPEQNKSLSKQNKFGLE